MQEQVNLEAGAGAISVWGCELIAPLSSLVAGFGSDINSIFGGLDPASFQPAVATSGTATTFDAILNISNATSTVPLMSLIGVLNDV